MNEFLDLNTPAEFWKILKQNIKINPVIENIYFRKSLGRVLAQNIHSPVNLPPFSRSTVDGFAVRSIDTAGASASLPIYLNVIGEVLMGKETDLELKPGEAVKIPTGGMLPDGADAVLMVEYIEFIDKNTIESSAAVAVGENVVVKGEDIKKDKLLLNKSHTIRPQDIGAMAGLGITEIEVFRRPVVTIISTGDELVPPEMDARPGEIRDINTYALGALLEEAGANVKEKGIVEDSFAELQKEVKDSLDSDLILISGGSSVGVKDMTVDIFNSLGKPGVLLHGVSVKPGKPTILAMIEGKPLMGLPGHPASAWTIANKFVLPIVNILSQKKTILSDGKESDLFTINGIINRNLSSDKGREEYVPVKLKLKKDKCIQNNIKYALEPIVGKSGLITTLVEADGFLKIESDQEGLNKGELVTVQLFKGI